MSSLTAVLCVRLKAGQQRDTLMLQKKSVLSYVVALIICLNIVITPVSKSLLISMEVVAFPIRG